MLLVEASMAAERPKPGLAEAVFPPQPPVKLADLGTLALYAQTGALIKLNVVGENLDVKA